MWIVKISGLSFNDAYLLADEIYENGFLSASAVEDSDEEVWKVEAISEDIISYEYLDNLRILEKYKVTKKDFSIASLPEVDWVRQSLENFKPFTVGDFYIFGAHTSLRDAGNVKDKICIEMDAATAFGSGEHPTTAGCLIACSSFFQSSKHKVVLDLGCGSGILAIALAKLGAETVYAYDSDPEAVRVAYSNIKKNKVINSVKVFQNESLEFTVRKYDLIVSNILAQPLIELSEYICSSLNDNGILILSGYKRDQGVEEQYCQFKMQIIHQIEIDDWLTTIFRKND